MGCPVVTVDYGDKKVITNCMKYNLTIEEAAEYFNIGEKKLRSFFNEHHNENFTINVGTKTLVKRKLFEKYLDENVSSL